MVALRAQGRQMPGTTTQAYQQGAIRQGGVTPQMAAFRRNPEGWADLRRIASSLVIAILLTANMSSSSFLALLAVEPSAAMWVFC